jgi:NAD-dependent SIR2 family protein deacetylase
MLVVSHNIDGLLERTALPREQFVSIHGTLFRYPVPIVRVPILIFPNMITLLFRLSVFRPMWTYPPAIFLCRKSKKLISLIVPHATVSRPGILWFGEELPKNGLATVDDFLAGQGVARAEVKKIDVVIVFRTSAMV